MSHFAVVCAILVCTLQVINGSPIPDVGESNLVRLHIENYEASLENDHERDIFSAIRSRTHFLDFNQRDLLRLLTKQKELTSLAATLYKIPILKEVFDEAGKTNGLVRVVTAFIKQQVPSFGDIVQLINGGSRFVIHDISVAGRRVLDDQYQHQGLSAAQKWAKAVGKQIRTTHTEMTDNKYMVTSTKGRRDDNVNVAQFLSFIAGNAKPLLAMVKEVVGSKIISEDILLYNLMKLKFDVLDSKSSLELTYNNADQNVARDQLVSLLTETTLSNNSPYSFKYSELLIAAQGGLLPAVRTFHDIAEIVFGITN